MNVLQSRKVLGRAVAVHEVELGVLREHKASKLPGRLK